MNEHGTNAPSISAAHFHEYLSVVASKHNLSRFVFVCGCGLFLCSPQRGRFGGAGSYPLLPPWIFASEGLGRRRSAVGASTEGNTRLLLSSSPLEIPWLQGRLRTKREDPKTGPSRLARRPLWFGHAIFKMLQNAVKHDSCDRGATSGEMSGSSHRPANEPPLRNAREITFEQPKTAIGSAQILENSKALCLIV